MEYECRTQYTSYIIERFLDKVRGLKCVPVQCWLTEINSNNLHDSPIIHEVKIGSVSTLPSCIQ